MISALGVRVEVLQIVFGFSVKSGSSLEISLLDTMAVLCKQKSIETEVNVKNVSIDFPVRLGLSGRVL